MQRDFTGSSALLNHGRQMPRTRFVVVVVLDVDAGEGGIAGGNELVGSGVLMMR